MALALFCVWLVSLGYAWGYTSKMPERGRP
jgi:hypothetical protein